VLRDLKNNQKREITQLDDQIFQNKKILNKFSADKEKLQQKLFQSGIEKDRLEAKLETYQ
jgi:hypothetical protein